MRTPRLTLLLAILALPGVSLYGQCRSLTALATAAEENFDTLANTGTTNTALPSGWLLSETGTNANAAYGAGTGSSTAGDVYSFGAAASTERAFGTLRSGTLIPVVGACFTNNTGATVN
jgi:uncharacterized protein